MSCLDPIRSGEKQETQICRADNKQKRKTIRLTLLSVGTFIRKTDLQSVHEGGDAPTDVPLNECEGAIPIERGENEYEPICYRRSD